jgi:nicotinamide-nucleotide amidase
VIVEVIAVGTELLIGQIVNSNAAHIGAGLAAEGFDAHYQVTVGDNIERLATAIREGLARSDAVVLTGGIGPTQDDQTRDAICAVLGVDMARDEAHADHIRDRLLKARGYVAETTLRMADYPEGSEPLPNGKGVALGVAAEHEGKLIFAMPGVPTEMTVMFEEQVLPRLRAASGEPAILKSRLLRTWGYGESQVSEMLDDLYETTNPSVAFLITASEVKIRISAKAEDEAVADAMIAGIESVVRERLGDAVFGADDETIDTLVAGLLAKKRWTVATVETSTLGMLATRLATAIGDGVSFAGGAVVPRIDGVSDVRRRALGLLDDGAEADVVVAVSEVVGDGHGSGSRRVGVAVRTPDGEAARTIALLGDDERARRFTVPGAMHAVRLAVSGAWWDESA